VWRTRTANAVSHFGPVGAVEVFWTASGTQTTQMTCFVCVCSVAVEMVSERERWKRFGCGFCLCEFGGEVMVSGKAVRSCFSVCGVEYVISTPSVLLGQQYMGLDGVVEGKRIVA
jgi:hypothetical protein